MGHEGLDRVAERNVDHVGIFTLRKCGGERPYNIAAIFKFR
jgi:hypothetical protein